MMSLPKEYTRSRIDLASAKAFWRGFVCSELARNRELDSWEDWFEDEEGIDEDDMVSSPVLTLVRKDRAKGLQIYQCLPKLNWGLRRTWMFFGFEGSGIKPVEHMVIHSDLEVESLERSIEYIRRWILGGASYSDLKKELG